MVLIPELDGFYELIFPAPIADNDNKFMVVYQNKFMVVISFVCDVEICILLKHPIFSNHFLVLSKVGFVMHSCFTRTLVFASSTPEINTLDFQRYHFHFHAKLLKMVSLF